MARTDQTGSPKCFMPDFKYKAHVGLFNLCVIGKLAEMDQSKFDDSQHIGTLERLQWGYKIRLQDQQWQVTMTGLTENNLGRGLYWSSPRQSFGLHWFFLYHLILWSVCITSIWTITKGWSTEKIWFQS